MFKIPEDVAKVGSEVTDDRGRKWLRRSSIVPVNRTKMKKAKVIEDSEIMDSDGEIYANNMALAEPPEVVIPEVKKAGTVAPVEMLEGFKTSKTKESLMKSETIPQTYKTNVIEDDPMFYETSNRIIRELESNKEIKDKTYDAAVREVVSRHKEDSKAYNSKEGQSMIQALIKKNIELRSKYADNGFYQEQYEELQKAWRETGTDVAQSLNMRKQLYGDSLEGKLINKASDKTAQMKLAIRIFTEE